LESCAMVVIAATISSVRVIKMDFFIVSQVLVK
jgi:hypothetical protein